MFQRKEEEIKIECPICMDTIEGNKNCITTDCGHCFHANCLMTNVAHNGFCCPYCRTSMAEDIDEDIDEDEDDDDDEYEDEDDEIYIQQFTADMVLRGFRFFMNNINQEEYDEQDIEDEEVSTAYCEQEQEEPGVHVPTTDFITESLVSQGVTMEDLVKVLLLNHEEYDKYEKKFDRLDGEIFGKMRIIISNFTPTQQSN
jgi:hypothetical protein